MVGAQARRESVRMAQTMGLSARKACALLTISRCVLRYALKMPEKDAPYLEAMRRFAAGNCRRGYRPARVRLLAEGFQLGREKALRLWRKADLLVPRKRPRKRIARSGPAVEAANGLNQIWAYDFVHDMCASGQALKCLTVIDEYSREALAIEVSGSIRSERVLKVLSRLFSERGTPQYLRSDNGPEFVSRKLREWTASQGLSHILTEPGKPWQNGYNESFNGKFRDECLSAEWFRNIREARAVIETWRIMYNTQRTHSSLGDVPPSVYAEQETRRSGRHAACSRDMLAGLPPASAAPPLLKPSNHEPFPTFKWI